MGISTTSQQQNPSTMPIAIERQDPDAVDLGSLDAVREDAQDVDSALKH